MGLSLPLIHRAREATARKPIRERLEEHEIYIPEARVKDEEGLHKVLDVLERQGKKLGRILGHLRLDPEKLLPTTENLLEALVERGVVKVYEIPRDHGAIKEFLGRFDNSEELVKRIEKHLNLIALERGLTGEIHLDVGHIFNQVYLRGASIPDGELRKLVEEALKVKKEKGTAAEVLKKLGVHENVSPHLSEEHLRSEAYLFYRKGKEMIIPPEVSSLVERARRGNISKEEAWKILEAVTRDHNWSVIKLTPKV